MNPTIDQIVSLCKRRGFIYPGSEIYGGFANSYTYGPYGSQLKKNIKNLWWRTFVENRADILGIDADIILHPRAWEASGHVGGFNDLMVDCKKCKARLRADHLIEDQTGMDCEGKSETEVTEIIREKKLKCPKCGSIELTDARKFNLMFQTEMAKAAEESTAYLRPETAQAMFLEFKNILDSSRVKLPFGIAQIGKAFRNEITPGNFIFRRLEFEQMEIEYFFHPPKNFAENRKELMKKSHLNDWPKEMADWVNSFFDTWQKAMEKWCDVIGLSAEKCHIIEHKPEKLSHYSKRTFDIEFDFPFGRKELYGCAYRTDFDLAQHESFSGKNLKFRDPETNEVFIPHVIEPTFGVDRTILAVLTSVYDEEKLKDGTIRTVLHLPASIAPVRYAVLPLMKKDGMAEKAREIVERLQSVGAVVEYDDGGAIGKRYRRQDEIGTPTCITIDYDTLEDDTVTVRDRDSMEQKRIEINALKVENL